MAKWHFVIITGSIYEKKIPFINMYFPNNGNNGTAKYMKYDLAKQQGKSIIITEIFNTTQ